MVASAEMTNCVIPVAYHILFDLGPNGRDNQLSRAIKRQPQRASCAKRDPFSTLYVARR